MITIDGWVYYSPKKSTKPPSESQRLGAIEVGRSQAELLSRARRPNGSGQLMTKGEIERMAARRLVERGLLERSFPGAPDGAALRRFYRLTPLGRHSWLKARANETEQ